MIVDTTQPLTKLEARYAVRYGTLSIVVGIIAMAGAVEIWRTETAPSQYLALLPLIGAIFMIARGWAYTSAAYGDDGAGGGPWWAFGRVMLSLTRIPAPDQIEPPGPLLGLRHVWYVLLAGGLAFANAAALPQHYTEAFYLGGGIGTLIFVRMSDMPRVRGISYLFATALWCYLLLDSGLVEQIVRSVQGG